EFQKKNSTPINVQSIQELARFAQMGSVKLPGQAADTQRDGDIGATEKQDAGSGLGFVGDKKAPIIGVVSKKSGGMYRSYYGIEEYDHALFFSDIPVLAGGFVNPFVLGGG